MGEPVFHRRSLKNRSNESATHWKTRLSAEPAPAHNTASPAEHAFTNASGGFSNFDEYWTALVFFG